MDFIGRLLSTHGPDLVTTLVAKAGFSEVDARGFLTTVLGEIEALFGRDESDGSVGAGLLSRLDPAKLGNVTGIGVEQARAGLGAIAPMLGERLETLRGSDSDSAGIVGGLARFAGGFGGSSD